LPDVRIGIALRRQPRHTAFQVIDAVYACFLPARTVIREILRRLFVAEAGFTDFDCVADQRRWLVFDGFEIA
jgi:adenylate cyclase